MHKFVRNLITEWRRLKLPIRDETVVVAVSGGADSVSLLLALDELRKRKKLDLRMIAAHFDHKLRGDGSLSDLEFVRALTIDRKIELAHGEWKRTIGGNLEQEARRARYDFLLKTAENVKANYVLTGHTMNDQAETVLMNLIRGSGIEGLGGMRPIRQIEKAPSREQSKKNQLPFPDPTISNVRPMLRWAKRKDTESFCRESWVEFCLDPMNEDISFRRVWIRKVLIPMLEEVNPKIIDSLCRTAELLQTRTEQQASTDGLPKTSETGEQTDSLYIRNLKTLDKPELYSALRNWLRANRGNLRGLELKHIESIERLIHSRKSGKEVELPGRGKVLKNRGRLVFGNIKVEK